MKKLAFGLVLAISALALASATVIHVPADQPTIQTGINAAVNGDTVLVAPGTYYEHINFNGKRIVVKSEAGPQTTAISKSVNGIAIVTLNSGEDTTAVLWGFTISGAVGIDGIRCLNSGCRIVGNVIENNNKGSAG